MKKILIISNSFPNYGGQSTTAYNLLKLLKKDGVDARLIYINYAKQSNTDPENTGSSHKIALKKSLPYKFYHWYKQRFNINPESSTYAVLTKAKDWYVFALLLPRLLGFMFSNKFRPDMVVTNIPVYYTLIKRIFDPGKILVVVGSSSEMYELSKQGIDAQTILDNNALGRQKLKNHSTINYSKTNVLFNSKLTQDVYHALGINTATSAVQYFNIAPVSVNKHHAFPQRKYDLAFIASDFNRSIKNIPLAKAIFQRFRSNAKIAIGKGSNTFNIIPNTTALELITQNEITDTLANTRLLIITSYFDSSPGILSEAILNGCNVLVSKNIGWHHLLDERCVVQDYNDMQEWASKATYLLQHQVSYLEFEDIIAHAQEDIAATIQNMKTR